MWLVLAAFVASSTSFADAYSVHGNDADVVLELKECPLGMARYVRVLIFVVSSTPGRQAQQRDSF
jgi:hypothetical protein